MQPSNPLHEGGCEGGDVERGEGHAKRQRTLEDMNGVVEQGRADGGRPPAELAASGAPAQAAAAHAPVEPIHQAEGVPVSQHAPAGEAPAGGVPTQEYPAAALQHANYAQVEALAMAAAMNAGTWGAEGGAGPSLELLQQLHQVATAAQLTPEQHSVLLAASMPPGGAPNSMDAGYLEQLQQGAHLAGGEGGGLNGTPGEAQAAGGVMRVQSRPPPPAKQFETPRRTVKPFTEVEVETLVEGVCKFGIGRWREILTAPESEGRFDPVRTGVDLKDKWRSLVSAVMGNKDTRRVALKDEWKQKIRTIVEHAPARRSSGATAAAAHAAAAAAAMHVQQQAASAPAPDPTPDHQGLTQEQLLAQLAGHQSMSMGHVPLQAPAQMGLSAEQLVMQQADLGQHPA